jgi:hypothetical protein
MMAPCILLVGIITLLLLIDRRSVPGMAYLLYFAGAATVIIAGAKYSGILTEDLLRALIGTIAGAVIYAVIAAVYSFAFMGNQGRKSPLDTAVFFGTPVALAAVAYFASGTIAAAGVLAGIIVLAIVVTVTDAGRRH